MGIIVTIGRKYGSGGRYVGELLAKKLGINFYDSNLIDKVAENSGLSKEFIKENDEKKESFFSFFSMSGNIGEQSASQKVNIEQFNTIQKLAKEESFVIVGRCADYVLRDNPDVIKVFITASDNDCAKRAVEYYGLDEKKALQIISKKNKKRESYYNFYTSKKWGAAESYDVCLNTSIGIENCVDIIADIVNGKERNK